MRLTRAVKNCWRNDSEKTADDAIEHYASLDLLIVDEVGVQFGSAAEMAILQEIINARYEGILPTILISNLSPEVGVHQSPDCRQDHRWRAQLVVV